MITRRTTLLRESFKPDVNVMATSLLVPSELAWALNCVPLNLEMFSSLLASHSKIIDLSNKGSLTAPRCSFINSVKGALLENLIPRPDLMVSSSAYCEGVSYVFEDFRQEFGTDHYHIDLPVYTDENSYIDLAQQMKSLFGQMAAKLGMDIAEAHDNFRKVMYQSTIARKQFMELWQFRHEHGPVDLGLEPLHWHMQFLPMWGDEKAAGICERLKNEFIEYAQNQTLDEDAVPIAFFGLIPYGRTEMWSVLNENKAYMAFEGVNFLGDFELLDSTNFDDFSIDELFENLAKNLINVPMRGGNIIEKSEFFMKEAKQMGAKGMMIISHEHCQLLAPRLHEMENEATKINLKVVSLGGDCILGMPKGPTNFRLRTFLSSITNVAVKQTDFKSLLPINENMVEAGYRLGVDFGSGFSKFMLLDEKLDVMKSGIVSSGIDYPGLLNDITRKLALDGPVKLAVAGIGSDNPVFKNLVQKQTTEINALIGSCRQLFKRRDNLLVIDIGTQDVKILHFNNMDDAPWINTNKSCGAGTGMVLVQILERWKQTMPNFTYDTLDKLALEAEESEIINTTCGIFAVTNVVSALVQASERRRRAILRGLYDYVATQAIKLLPPELQNGYEVYLTGGVESHQTLKEVFVQRGFKLITPEKDIHPQFLVAFGTALSVH
ncbi:2-hydroxyacyl-CoA dehydratase [Carboxylicivirga sp. N1Y90]|uniref:2-hydroxyacyl-CoA dehydratase n=1 Tax=Carboxylicivirga fragile TaxID=3417571 RepID=UPI003D327CFD|nr:2-hydroxyacyl-CoA dehydratase [Marinilabiliaceae bacterium N1Y90]